MWGGPRNPFILGGAALSLSAVITPILGGGGSPLYGLCSLFGGVLTFWGGSEPF